MNNNTQNRAKQLLNARRSHYVNRDGISEQKHLKARIRALKRKLGYVEISADDCSIYRKGYQDCIDMVVCELERLLKWKRNQTKATKLLLQG